MASGLVGLLQPKRLYGNEGAVYKARMRKGDSEPEIDDPEYIRRMLRANLEAQRRIQAEIKMIDAWEGSGVWLDETSEAHDSTGVQIDICRPDTELAWRSAAGIAKALTGAGFQTAVFSESRCSALKEPLLESGVAASAAALFLQGAFRIAGIPVLLTVDHRLTKTLRLHVGDEGLILCNSSGDRSSVIQ